MKINNLKYVVISWALLMLFNYYFMNFFFLAFELLALLLILFCISLIQLIRLVIEWKNITRQRFLNTSVFTTLFLLTLFNWIPNRVIEKADWLIFYDKRNSIVKQVQDGELEPNVSYNNWICELPYEFPPVSNGGNDIGIGRTKNNRITVEFWIFRNFFEAPSTKFVYTNDEETIMELEEKIKRNPDNNWKIEDGWYRTYNW